jgi:hypothetical protein
MRSLAARLLIVLMIDQVIGFLQNSFPIKEKQLPKKIKKHQNLHHQTRQYALLPNLPLLQLSF